METKYDVGDVVYVVKDYKVIKSIIDSVVIKKDASGKHTQYNLYSFLHQNEKRKIIAYTECFLVDDLETAKKSAMLNWNKIVKSITEQMGELKDEDFNPAEPKLPPLPPKADV